LLLVPYSDLFDSHLISQPSHSRVVSVMNLLVRVNCHNAESSLILSVASSKVKHEVHLDYNISVAACHPLNN